MGEEEGVGRRVANVSYQFKFWLSICQLSVKWLLLIKWRPKTSLTAVSFSPIFLSGCTQATQWADKKLSDNVHFLGIGKQVRVSHASYLPPNWTSKISLLYCLQTRLFILRIVWYKFLFSWFVFGIKCFGNVKTLTLYTIVLLFIQILTLAVYSSPSVFYWWKHSLPIHCFQNLAPLFHPNITDETKINVTHVHPYTVFFALHVDYMYSLEFWLVLGMVVVLCDWLIKSFRGFINVFNRRATSSHWPTKLFELNFL